MDRSNKIKLISETFTTDDIGQKIAVETETEIYASVASVGSAEFVAAGQLGLRPELRFTIFAPEYSGEKIVEYNGNRYAVYRTYIGKNEALELYTERKTGNVVSQAAGS